MVGRPEKEKKKGGKIDFPQVFFSLKEDSAPLFSVACVLSEQLLSGFFLPRQNEEEESEVGNSAVKNVRVTLIRFDMTSSIYYTLDSALARPAKLG